MKSFIFSLLFIISIASSIAGNLTIKDQTTKDPLPGVTIHFIPLHTSHRDSVKVARTNRQGVAKNPFNKKTFVVLSYVGYNKFADTIESGDQTVFLTQSSIMCDEVVVTGQLTPSSSQKSVYSVKVIDESKIASQGSSTLKDLLMTESNMRISQDNILGSEININGVSGANVKILIDGVPMIGRLNGYIDLNQINLNNIKRVEIVEGPMSSVYGSDALGGVINLITKEPDCSRLEFEGNSYYESVGVYNFDGSLRYNLDGFNFLIDGGRNLFQGFDLVDTLRDQQWNPKEQYFADCQAIYALDDHKFKLSSALFTEYVLNRGNLRPLHYVTAIDDKYRTLRISNSFFYNGKLSERHFLNVTGAYSYYNRKKNTYFKDMVTLDEKLVTDPTAQDTSTFDTYMLRAEFSDDALTGYLKYQAGVDINYDLAYGKKVKDLEQNISDFAVFASFQFIPFDFFTLQPAVRLIKNSKYDAPIVPSVNVKFDVFENAMLRLSYAKGFRSPSLKELYLEFVDVNHNIYGNEDLKAERSDSYNTSFEWRAFDESQFFSLEQKIFYNHILDLITLSNIDGTIYKNVNIGKYETVGGSLTFKYLRNNLSLTNVYSYTGRLNSISGETNTRKFNFSPEVSVSCDYSFKPWNAKLNFYYKFTGEMPGFMLIDEKPVEYFLSDYHMFDISISKQLFEYFNLIVGAKNLFDVKNISSTLGDGGGGVHTGGSEFPIGWGRTFFVKLNIRVN